MQHVMSFLAKALLISGLLSSLQACSPVATGHSDVALAYESSGTLDVQPYTRTIFSSTNF